MLKTENMHAVTIQSVCDFAIVYESPAVIEIYNFLKTFRSLHKGSQLQSKVLLVDSFKHLSIPLYGQTYIICMTNLPVMAKLDSESVTVQV